MPPTANPQTSSPWRGAEIWPRWRSELEIEVGRRLRVAAAETVQNSGCNPARSWITRADGGAFCPSIGLRSKVFLTWTKDRESSGMSRVPSPVREAVRLSVRQTRYRVKGLQALANRSEQVSVSECAARACVRSVARCLTFSASTCCCRGYSSRQQGASGLMLFLRLAIAGWSPSSETGNASAQRSNRTDGDVVA